MMISEGMLVQQKFLSKKGFAVDVDCDSEYKLVFMAHGPQCGMYVFNTGISGLIITLAKIWKGDAQN